MRCQRYHNKDFPHTESSNILYFTILTICVYSLVPSPLPLLYPYHVTTTLPYPHPSPHPFSPHPTPHPTHLPSSPTLSHSPVPIPVPIPPLRIPPSQLPPLPIPPLSSPLLSPQAAVVGELAKIASHIENNAERQRAYCKANAGEGDGQLNTHICSY